MSKVLIVFIRKKGHWENKIWDGIFEQDKINSFIKCIWCFTTNGI